MKKISIILFSVITISFLSCSKDDSEIDNVALAAENLEGTYSTTYVSLDGFEITSDFTEFNITIDKSLNFSTNSASLDRQPNPWPSNGSFTIVVPVESNTSVTLLRNDGIEFFAQLDEADASVELSFVFDADSNDNGRIMAVDGDWMFNLEK